MALKLATYARGTATGFDSVALPPSTISNPDDKPFLRVSMSVEDLARFPALRTNQNATRLSGALRDRAFFNDEWFHVVLRYESVGTINADRADWVEFLRVIWVGDTNARFLIGLRDIGATGAEVTTRPDGEEWEIAEGDVVSVTLATMAADLDVLQGVTHSHIRPAVTDTVWLGDSLKRFEHIYGKQVYAGEFLRLGTAISGPRLRPASGSGQTTLFVPPAIVGGTDDDNTLALRGDQTFDGCLQGTLCVVQNDEDVDDYPLVGGEFGDAIIVARWFQGTNHTEALLITQNRDYIDAVIPDLAENAGELRGTVTLGDGTSHQVRNVTFDDLGANNANFVNMSAEFPNALSLADFRAHMETISVSGYARTGTLVANRSYIDSVQGWTGTFQRLNPLRGFRFPTFDRVPLRTDDVSVGHQVGDLWFYPAAGVTYILRDATEGQARWHIFHQFGEDPEYLFNERYDFGTHTVDVPQGLNLALYDRLLASGSGSGDEISLTYDEFAGGQTFSVNRQYPEYGGWFYRWSISYVNDGRVTLENESRVPVGINCQWDGRAGRVRCSSHEIRNGGVSARLRGVVD